MYSLESELKIVGDSSYEFYPSRDGIMKIHEVYEPASLDSEDETLYLRNATNGFALKASLGDENYSPEVPRGVSIEIPYNKHTQYSYLSFGVKLVVASDFSGNFRGGNDIGFEIALDDGVGITYYLYGGNRTTIDDSHPLKYSLENVSLRFDGSGEQDGRIILKIENNLDTEAPHKIHLRVSSNFAACPKSASETVKNNYKETYVLILDPKLTITKETNYSLTYGNYNEYQTKSGNPVVDYWNLSRTIQDTPTQYLVEVPKNLSLGSNKTFSSNYNTADLYSDVITLKNQMDSEYRMQQTAEGEGVFSEDRFRRYTSADSCSDTISLYYDSDLVVPSIKDDSQETSGESEGKVYVADNESEKLTEHEHSTVLRYKRIETIKSINRFTSEIKHKSNLFSIIVHNSRVPEALQDPELKESAEKMRDVISGVVREICNKYAPVHNQLFKVYFD